MLTHGEFTRLCGVGCDGLVDATLGKVECDAEQLSKDVRVLFDAIVKLDDAQRERNQLFEQELSELRGELSELKCRRQGR